MRRLLTIIAAAVLTASGSALLLPSPAHAAYQSVCYGNEYEGTCYQQRSSVLKHVVVVDQSPVVNNSKITVTGTCSFSSTVTREVTLGGSVSVSSTAEVSFLKIAKASVSTTYTLSASVTMTASQAKEVGGTFTLKPGQRIVCQRIYSYVSFSERTMTYNMSAGTSYSATKTVTVPSSLGIRFVS